MNGAAEGPHLGQSYAWFSAGFSLVSLAGLTLAFRDQRDRVMDRLPLAICVLVFPIPYYFSLTDMRYRHPIDPFLAIFTVYALCKLWRAFSVAQAFYPERREGQPAGDSSSQDPSPQAEVVAEKVE